MLLGLKPEKYDICMSIVVLDDAAYVKISQHLFRIKTADIYPKAQRKYREEGESRDTAEDVVRRIMENKKIV